MSQQREWDEVSAERLAKCYRVLAEMIYKGCTQETILDCADEFGIDHKEVDKLWRGVMEVAA